MIPGRIRAETGRYSLVDGIPFELPVASHHSPALMAAFSIDADQAAKLLPGRELHPLRLPGGRGVLMITVIDYTSTNIGKYIEFSIAIAATHGLRPSPALLPLLFQRHYQLGQYVYDLPVSSVISVKGGKGIWGMPKHQANLDFRIDATSVSSQYDLDGQLAMRITIRRPGWTGLPVRMGAANFCQFRGMLFKSSIYFQGKIGLSVLRRGAAQLLIGDCPRTAPLKDLDINPRPIMTAFFPSSAGILDDHYEGWFLAFEEPPTVEPEGLESVVGLGLSQAWLPPPSCDGRLNEVPVTGPER
ncbi:MAG TPA: acetoacetate decarboxylase family protein [Acidimicrobiales bacterium]|nr:acetoacetate decarboxylase family protein [Acidimicrobiales bacterium]